MLRAWKEIDCNALVHNARVLSEHTPLMAVVKADAYGHGAVLVAKCLQQEGIRAFAVACCAEGAALRKAGIRGSILILGYTPPEEVPLLRRWRLTQTIADEAHGKALHAVGKDIHVHLALDTGMHRLGVPAEDTAALERLYNMPHLRIDGLFSHLCTADSQAPADADFTWQQLTRFYRAVDRLREHGCPPGKIHIQASYGLWNLPPQPCDYVRAGIALYGVYSSFTPVTYPLDLRPVLSLRAKVTCVRTLAPGVRAGYGLEFQAERETRLAILSIGYADGLPRTLSQNGGRVLLHGISCPIVGRICMDQLFVDTTELLCVRPGDTATFIGRDGTLEIRAEEVAQRCGTITNELLSRLGSRLEPIRK